MHKSNHQSRVQKKTMPPTPPDQKTVPKKKNIFTALKHIKMILELKGSRNRCSEYLSRQDANAVSTDRNATVEHNVKFTRAGNSQ